MIEFTTNPGLDSLAFSEFVDRAEEVGIARSAVRRKASGARGRVRAEADAPFERLCEAVGRMRSIHHILRPFASFELPEREPLAEIEARVSAIDWREWIDPAEAFRVTTRRYGSHDFTSVDVQRTAGAVIARATGASVDLIEHDRNVRVDVIDDTCLVALQLTREPLSHRFERAYTQRVTLRPNLAYAALRLAGISETTRTLLDPCCGSGTILLEAADLAPNAALLGSDRNPLAVEGARQNLALAGLAQRSRIDEIDLQQLSEHHEPGSVDLLVTNPPYGRHLGRGMHFFGFYACLLREADRVLGPEGRLVVFARKYEAFRSACRKSSFRMRHTWVIEAGGLFPAILVAVRNTSEHAPPTTDSSSREIADPCESTREHR